MTAERTFFIAYGQNKNRLSHDIRFLKTNYLKTNLLKQIKNSVLLSIDKNMSDKV